MREAYLTFAGAVESDPAVSAWLNGQQGELGSIAKTWFRHMRDVGPDVLEVFHDGCPNVCVGDAPFAYVNAFKSHVSVGFFQGAALPDPGQLLEGSGKRMRHVKIRAGQAVDYSAVLSLVSAAYRDISERVKSRQ